MSDPCDRAKSSDKCGTKVHLLKMEQVGFFLYSDYFQNMFDTNVESQFNLTFHFIIISFKQPNSFNSTVSITFEHM